MDLIPSDFISNLSIHTYTHNHVPTFAFKLGNDIPVFIILIKMTVFVLSFFEELPSSV